MSRLSARLFLASAAGVGIAQQFFQNRVMCAASQQPAEDRIWLSENRGGKFTSYVDMASATADQFFANKKGQFPSEQAFSDCFDKFYMPCLLALEAGNMSEFGCRLRLLQSTPLADLGNRFLAAAAYDMGCTKAFVLVDQHAPEVCDALKKSNRQWGEQSALVKSTSVERELAVKEWERCRLFVSEGPATRDYCADVEKYVNHKL